MTIAEKIVNYYNMEINKSGELVTLDWLKRQRIVEGRDFLDLQFGHEVVNKILGEFTFLAKAEEMLSEVEYNFDYKLLSEIARFLAWECDTILDSENPIREKYSSLEYSIPIPFYDSKSSNEELSFMDLQNPIQKSIPTNMLDSISTVLTETSKNNPCRCFFFEYLQNVAYHSLKIAFEEIRAEVEKVTK